MGNDNSTPNSAKKPLDLYYSNFNKNCKWGNEIYQHHLGTYTGGAGENSSKIIEYNKSMYSKAKEDLIRNIAKDIFPSGAINANAPIDQILKNLKKMVPDAKKNQRASKDPQFQNKLCAKIAAAINKNYGAALIDPFMDENKICDAAAEVIDTLAAGLHAEFLAAATDIKTIIENMVVLESYLGGVYTQVVEIIKKVDAPEANMALQNSKKLYDRVISELKRQLALLANIVNKVIPAYEVSIGDLVKESGKLKTSISAINENLGTREFGQKLGLLLADIDNVANLAATVDDALKKIGMPLKDFKAAKSLTELRKKVYVLQVHKDRQLNMQELQDFLEAEKTLLTAQGELNKDKIIEYLEKTKKGGQPTAPLSVWGTKTDTLGKKLKKHKEAKEKIFARFEDELQQHFKKIVADVHKIAPLIGTKIPVTNDLRNFVRAFRLLEVANRKNLPMALSGYKLDARSKDYRNRFLTSLDVLHHTILPLIKGSEKKAFRELADNIKKLAEHIDKFSRVFLGALTDPIEKDFQAKYTERQQKLGGDEFEFIELGDDEDIEGKVVKLSNELSDAVAEFEGGGDLSQEVLQMAARGGDLSSEVLQMAAKGGGDLSQEVLQMAAKGGDLSQEVLQMAAKGGDLSGEVLQMAAKGGDLSQEVLQMAAKGGTDNITGQLANIVRNTSDKSGIDGYISFKNVQAELAYYVKIANLKSSLNNMSKITTIANDNYKNRVGLAIATLINKEQSYYLTAQEVLKKIIAREDTSNKRDALKHNDPVRIMAEESKQFARDDIKRAGDSLCYLSELEFATKKKFYETIENIDLLLASFTENIGAHPDEVITLKKIIDQLVNVRKFFTDRSGDLLVKVFDTFPNDNNVVNYPLDDENKANLYDDELKAAHYYEALANKLPGDYSKGVPLITKDAAEKFVLRIKSALLGVRSLENIFATFSKLGSQYGKKNINDGAFMSHAEMFKNVNDYLAISSIGYRNVPDKTDVSTVCTFSLITTANNDFVNNFGQANEYFTMMIKAMISKILAVLGLYSIFNKPNFSMSNKINVSLSAVRTILGGADSEKLPEIIPDALELYIRLPLLAEWYRDTIGINRTKADGSKVYDDAGDNMMIAFIPDISGIWSNFIDLIFNKMNHINGKYTEYDVKRLIREINGLYNHYKKNPDITYAVCMGLVDTINERYGLIKKEEVKTYINTKKREDRYDAVDNWDVNDDPVQEITFDILGTDETRRHAPSDKYLDMKPIDIKKTDKWSEEVRNTIKQFRENLYQGFARYVAAYSDYTTFDNPFDVQVSFDEIIRQNKRQLAKTDDMSKKYDIVKKAMSGGDRYNASETNKLIMFSETVISPLVSLHQLALVLDRFRNNIKTPAARPNTELVHLFEQLYSVGYSTDLVKIHVSSDKTISIDFTAMREEVEKILNTIKLSISKFRLILDKNFIAKFEQSALVYNNAPVENHLAVYNIENLLLEDLLKNDAWDKSDSLFSINPHISQIVNKIVDKKTIGDSMAALCYWDAKIADIDPDVERESTEFPFTVLNLVEFPDTSSNKLFDNMNAGITGKSAIEDRKNAEDMGGFYINKIADLYDRGQNGLYRSSKYNMGLLMQFNQILAKYVQIFFDNNLNKFYAPLISDLAHGFFSNAIMNGEALNDLGGVVDGIGDPKPGVIIYASIARTIKVILLKQTNNTMPKYRVDNLSDLPDFYIELMKTNLPGFIKLFNLIIDRACLLKLILTDILPAEHVTRTYNAPKSGDRPGLYVGYTDIATNDYFSYLSSMLDNIRSAASIIKNSAERVYKELNDIPLFMETYPNLFNIYRAQSGSYPLTLLSNLQVLMVNPKKVNESKLLPFYKTGPYAKYNRGVRGVFNNNKYGFDYMPGFMQFIGDYNSLLPGISQFDKNLLAGVIDGQVKLSKYLGDIKHYKSQFGLDIDPDLSTIELNYDDTIYYHSNLLEFDRGVPLSDPTITADKYMYIANAYFEPYIVYSLGDTESYSQLLYLIENGNCGESREVLSKFLLEKHSSLRNLNVLKDREKSQFYNIMDLDIVPINVHALAREVPLINILNYAYSYDRMMIELLDIPPADVARVVGGVDDPDKDKLTDEDARGLNTRDDFDDGDNVMDPDRPSTSTMLRVNVPIKAEAYEEMLKSRQDTPVGENKHDEPQDSPNKQTSPTLSTAPPTSTTDTDDDDDATMLASALSPPPSPRPSALQPPPFAPFVNTPTGQLYMNFVNMEPSGDILPKLLFKYDKEIDADEMSDLGRFMVGGTGRNGFDRPKYLSDQLWNKVLIQELNPILQKNPDISGPLVNWFVSDKGFSEMKDIKNIDTSLTYYKNVDELAAVQFKTYSEKAKRTNIGIKRFDTLLVRNITWITNLQRIIRWYLKHILQPPPAPLAYNVQVARKSNTEYNNNQIYNPRDYGFV